MEQYSRPHPSVLQKLIQSKIKEEEEKLMQSKVKEEKLIQSKVKEDEKLIQSKVKEEKLVQSKEKEEDKEQTPLCQVMSETYHDCIITVKPKPNLKRKWTPAPPKSSK